MAVVDVADGPRLKCEIPEGLSIHEGDQCVASVDGALEYGRVSEIRPRGTGVRSGPDEPKVVRQATLQDQSHASENAVRSKMAMDTCVERAAKCELDMRLVRVRFSFDRKVLTVVFTSELRVDFREMVKELAGELRARIEMRQIGVRDEAGVIGGMGPCGRALCCCTWLKEFESVNVKMAKQQRLSLNPGAISGMCGRLKCCLGYEYEQYRQLGRNLPRTGETVQCSEGRGCVVGVNVLGQRCKVCLEDKRVVECDAEDVKRNWVRTGRDRPPDSREADGAWDDPDSEPEQRRER